MGVAERGGAGSGGTHINISSIDIHPTKGMKGGRVGGGGDRHLFSCIRLHD